GSAAHQKGLMRSVSTAVLVGLVLLTCVLAAPARVVVGGAVLALLAGYSLGRLWLQGRWLWNLGGLLRVPIVLLVLGGMRSAGLSPVSTTQWGGLMLTLLLATLGIVASFPLGVLLALGRQSTLPVIRWFAIAYIELVRGVPLVSVIMMFALLLPLFLPARWVRPNPLLRILVGLTLFTAAYLADTVRGGF